MDVLVIGGGGREHAICKAIKDGGNCGKLYCAPGNAGIAEIAKCLPIGAMDFEKIVEFSKSENIGLVFVAPDNPLAGGLVDKLTENGIRAFGPSKAASEIESSKAYAKDFMKRHNIPTADYRVFDNIEDAYDWAEKSDYPLVIKADGLALGKGVIIANDYLEAKEALVKIMENKAFGDSGKSVVIEEFLSGNEVTVLAFTDGKTIKCMPSSQDHKKAFDGDLGPNTGGMGAFSPSLYYTPDIQSETMRNIILPTIKGMAEDGRPFKGVLYFGLMVTGKGVKVIEYNARFGDPETQALLPLLKTDLLTVCEAIIDEKLSEIKIEWENKSCLTVVLASGGYPDNVIKGYPISIEKLSPEVTLYHSGTAYKDNELITNGGRVFSLSAVCDTIEEARDTVYKEIKKIRFKDMRYRKDIGNN